MSENKKVLIIEDEESLAVILQKKLKKDGFEAKISYDGEAGVKSVMDWKPDLILLDIIMPKLDGFGVLEKMKEENIEIPVIIISNSGQPVEIEKAKDLGAIDHLIKTEFEPAEVIEKVKKYFSKGGDSLSSSPILANVDPNKSGGIKVMLVEDDSFLREICAKKLTKEGYAVFEIIDGEQAVEQVEKINPDIVLLDIIMPALDGFGVLEKIRSHKNAKIKKVPIIMLSNLGQKDDVEKAMDMGANNYLIKAHFTTEEIISKIKGELDK